MTKWITLSESKVRRQEYPVNFVVTKVYGMFAIVISEIRSQFNFCINYSGFVIKVSYIAAQFKDSILHSEPLSEKHFFTDF